MSRDINWEYKEFFPRDYVCPPNDALSINCDIFRFSKDKNMSDFYPRITIDKSLINTYKNDPKSLCYSSGFSVYLTESAADFNYSRLSKSNPKYIIDFKHLFKTQIKHDDGKIIKSFKHDHHTFWSINGKVSKSNFTYLKEY